MWKDIRKALSVASIFVGAVAASLEDPYAKIMFAVALGLSNAAIFLRKDANGSGKTT
jgi:hypothetical protein